LDLVADGIKVVGVLLAAAALLLALAGCVTRNTTEITAAEGATVTVDVYMDDQYKGRSAISDGGPADSSGDTTTDPTTTVKTPGSI
jgi:hypothetical protein